MRKPLSRAYNRDVSMRKAQRKRRITQNWYTWDPNWVYYNHLHQYSKNKVHCSCGICMNKIRNKGHRRYVHGNYAPSINYKHSDLKRQVSMDLDEQKFYLFCEDNSQERL